MCALKRDSISFKCMNCVHNDSLLAEIKWQNPTISIGKTRSAPQIHLQLKPIRQWGKWSVGCAMSATLFLPILRFFYKHKYVNLLKLAEIEWGSHFGDRTTTPSLKIYAFRDGLCVSLSGGLYVCLVCRCVCLNVSPSIPV